MAIFCMSIGIAPSEYRRLTFVERQAFIDLWIERYGEDE